MKTHQLLLSLALTALLATPLMAYVGSEACQNCHAPKYEQWLQSGHPYKLTKILGEAPIDQFPVFSQYPNDPVDPPVGLTWDDITYTIGGYGWKMRWMDSDGYIITSGAAADLVQYNFENDSWVTYHTGDEPGTKPYNCGGCHTTGWVANPDPTDLTGNQDGLPGIHGTFEFGGIHCEQCHGEGDDHIGDPFNVDMIVDTSSAACGECHTRDAENRIAASGGFIKHHEQYDEWLHSPHINGPGCNDCHDPHASVKFDDEAAGDGNLLSCEGCHPDQAAHNEHNGMPTCTDCHIAKASKTAVAFSPFQGDIATHIFAINTAPVGKTEGMFTEDGSLVITDADGQAKVTLDFACYGCHQDENGDGGTFSMRTLEELSEYAINIHGTSVGVDNHGDPDTPVLDHTVQLSAAPNPFNPVVEVKATMPRAGHVRTSIHDARGHEVRVLHDGVMSAGESRWVWDGRDGTGRKLASGVYLIRLVTPERELRKTVTMVK